MNRVLDEFNSILTKYGIKLRLTIDDLIITDEVITDLIKEEPKLSNAIINYLWPSIAEDVVYHYAPYQAAENIIKSKTLRLYSLVKRLDDDEIKTFCANHDLTGYLGPDENGVPVYKSLLLPIIHYSSFTGLQVGDSEEYFWRQFAHSDGARFKFRITATNPDFRKILYENKGGKPIPLLTDFMKSASDKFKRKFILAGFSRLCAFYLPSKYKVESEYRIVYKKFEGYGPVIYKDGDHSYIEVPIDIENGLGFRVDLLEVMTDSLINQSDPIFRLRGS